MRAPLLPPPRGAALLGAAAFVAAVVALALFPNWVTKPYVIQMGAVLFVTIIQGLAWNVVGGYCGQYSVGHAAYFGLGAYVTMMLLEFSGVPPWLGVWPAMVVAALVSVAIGAIAFRLRGPYFVLASIALAEIIRLLVLHYKQYTKGAEGILVGEMPVLRLGGLEIDFTNDLTYSQVGLAMAVAMVGVNLWVRHSKAGYYFQAIREDQDAAHSLGINPTRTKLLALAISAAFTAFAGGFSAMMVQRVDPGEAFSIEISVAMVLTCIIGGIGTTFGPVLGAMILIPLREVLRNPRGLAQLGFVRADSAFVTLTERYLKDNYLLVYGVLVVVFILFAPDGALGLLRAGLARLRRRGAAEGRA
jgi:branched-chain amino acid transport system permease protein